MMRVPHRPVKPCRQVARLAENARSALPARAALTTPPSNVNVM